MLVIFLVMPDRQTLLLQRSSHFATNHDKPNTKLRIIQQHTNLKWKNREGRKLKSPMKLYRTDPTVPVCTDVSDGWPHIENL